MGANHSSRGRENDDPRASLRARARLRSGLRGSHTTNTNQQQEQGRTELRFVPEPAPPLSMNTTTTTTNDINNNNDGVITKKTSTIRNHVNVKKSSVLISMEANAIEFTYDATKKCAASLYVCQKGWMGMGASKFIAVAHRKPCEAGFSETVSVAIGKEVVRSLRSLTNNEETTDGFAVIIRLECVGDQVETQEEANRVLFKKDDEERKEEEEEGEQQQQQLKQHYFDPVKAFESIDASVQAQTTFCSVPQSLSTTEENLVKLQVVKQHIFVNGSSYELQEIYGIDNNSSNNSNNNNSLEQQHNLDQFQQQQQQQQREEEDEIMCVVCLSEPKDTTVLPCRHMCMCSECARALRFQSNKCPICRNPVESLLEISILTNDYN